MQQRPIDSYSAACEVAEGDCTVSRVVNLNGEQIEMDVAVNYMDDEIREVVHEEMAPCSDQQFVDAYAAAHKVKHGEIFAIN